MFNPEAQENLVQILVMRQARKKECARQKLEIFIVTSALYCHPNLLENDCTISSFLLTHPYSF